MAENYGYDINHPPKIDHRRWRVIIDTGIFINSRGAQERNIVYEKIEPGQSIFNLDEQEIIAPEFPDIPKTLRDKCSMVELVKWDKDRELYRNKATDLWRAIA